MTLAVSQASMAASESSASIGVSRAVTSVDERRHGGLTNDREHPLHAVVEPHAVAIVGEHAELDDRVVARIGRTQSHLAL